MPITAHLLIDSILCLWNFFHFPCLQAPDNWLHCYRKEWILRSLYRTGFTLPWVQRRTIVAELKGHSWQVVGSQTVNKFITASSLLASLPLTLSISHNPGSFLTRIIKLGEQHNVFYKECREQNKQTKHLGAYALSHHTHTCDHGASHVSTLGSYLYLIIAEMPIPWFLNEVHKLDMTPS